MNKHIETTPIINALMNSHRQFWDLWLDGLGPFVEAESNLLHIQGNKDLEKGTKELENSLRKLTNTTLDAQERILCECCDLFSEAVNQDSNTASGNIFKFWKKEVKNIGELEEKSLLRLSPLFNLYNPQNVLERMEEFTSAMSRNVEAMEQHVADAIPEQTSDSAISTIPIKPVDMPLKKDNIKQKPHVSAKN